MTEIFSENFIVMRSRSEERKRELAHVPFRAEKALAASPSGPPKKNLTRMCEVFL
jgi:hypothetical protein